MKKRIILSAAFIISLLPMVLNQYGGLKGVQEITGLINLLNPIGIASVVLFIVGVWVPMKKPVFNKVCAPTKVRIDFIFGLEDMERLKKLQQFSPESIYRISEIEDLDGHKVVDSGSRYGYFITRSI